jgi:acid phosphatase class B
MNSDTAEVRSLLKVLASKIEASPAVMKSQEIANALWGLQGMNSDYIEVRQVVSALTGKLATAFSFAVAKDQALVFTGQGIGNALCGLQSMSDEVPETVQLLGYFPEVIMNSPAVMRPQDIGNSLFGLQVYFLEY